MAVQNCVTAGYVTTYSAGPSHNFTFLTIKGAGHSASQPRASCLSTFSSAATIIQIVLDGPLLLGSDAIMDV